MPKVEKGFTLKGFTIGDTYEDSEVKGVIVAIEDCSSNLLDLAIFSEEWGFGEQSIEEAIEDVNSAPLYYLEEYSESENICWANSNYSPLF